MEEKNKNNEVDEEIDLENYKDSYDYFKLRTVYELMKEEYYYNEELFKLRDNKSNSFLNISILVLTIEVSFLASNISNFLINKTIVINDKIIFLILYLTNIGLNLVSIYYLYKAYKVNKYKANVNSKTIYEYYFGDEKGNTKEVNGILNQGIVTMRNAIEYNTKKLSVKTKNLKIGCELLFYSVIALVCSIAYYLIIMVR